MGLIKKIEIENYNDYKVLNALKIDSATVKIGKVCFYKNARIPTEGYAKHSEDEYVCVLKGIIAFGTEDEEYSLKEGDFHFLPKGENHWCQNIRGDDSELMFFLVS